MSSMITKGKNYISETAATATLQKLFSSSLASDKVSLDELLSAFGRENIDEATNKNWISNKLSQLKYHSLVKPVYEFDINTRRNKLAGVQLTMAGKKALGRIEVDEPVKDQQEGNDDSVRSKHTSINDALAIVRELRRQNPDFEIVFTIKPKEEVDH